MEPFLLLWFEELGSSRSKEPFLLLWFEGLGSSRSMEPFLLLWFEELGSSRSKEPFLLLWFEGLGSSRSMEPLSVLCLQILHHTKLIEISQRWSSPWYLFLGSLLRNLCYLWIACSLYGLFSLMLSFYPFLFLSLMPYLLQLMVKLYRSANFT